MSYHKFTNLGEIFQGDLNDKPMEGITSQAFTDLECDCMNSTAVNGKCICGGDCRKSIAVCKAACKEGGCRHKPKFHRHCDICPECADEAMTAEKLENSWKKRKKFVFHCCILEKQLGLCDPNGHNFSVFWPSGIWEMLQTQFGFFIDQWILSVPSQAISWVLIVSMELKSVFIGSNVSESRAPAIFIWIIIELGVRHE